MWSFVIKFTWPTVCINSKIRGVEAVIFQPLLFPHLSLPLPLTKNEKTTVDLCSTKFVVY